MAKASESSITRRTPLSAGLATAALPLAADAVLMLINSKPRSPTRDEIAAGLNGVAAEHDNNSPWKPAKLGLEMLELLPEYAEAIWYG